MRDCLLKVLLLLLAGVLLAGCETRSTIPTGKMCVVQFRRDALGAAGTLPISPTTDGVNGAEVSLTGTLKGMSSDWIIITQGTTDHWIAANSVLMLTIEPTMHIDTVRPEPQPAAK